MRRVIGLLSVAACLGVACGGSESDTPSDEATSDTEIESPPEPPGPATLAGDIVVPDVVGFSLQLNNDDASCRSLEGDFFAPAVAVDFRIHEAQCAAAGDMVAENGNRGQYVSIGDVGDAAIAGEVSFGSTDLGDFAAFEHRYVECTNECVEFVAPMVLLELTEPLVLDSGTFPSIVFEGEPEASVDDVIDLVRTLERDH